MGENHWQEGGENLMLSDDDKKKFLEELEQTPFPSIACKRAGISKATIYRWRSEDADFKKAMGYAIASGRETITESAEAHTVMLIKKGDMRAIKLWLENNADKYYKPRKPRSEHHSYRGVTAITITTDATRISAPGAEDIPKK